MSFGIPIWSIFKEALPPNTVFAPWFTLFLHKCFLICPPFLLSMSLIPSYAWPEAECLFFFSIVLISVDAKNKALKVFCIWPYTRRKEFFHQIVSLYYLRKFTRQITIKRSGKERSCIRWDYEEVVHYTALWMTPFNVQDAIVFLAHVCECFWNLF